MATIVIVGDGPCAVALRGLIDADRDLALARLKLFAKFTVTMHETPVVLETRPLLGDLTIDFGPRASRLELRAFAHVGYLLQAGGQPLFLARFGAGVPDDNHLVIRLTAGNDVTRHAVAHGLYRALLDERHGVPL